MLGMIKKIISGGQTGADRADTAGSSDERGRDRGVLPAEGNLNGDVLPMAGEVWRDGGVGGQAVEGIGSRKRAVKKVAGRDAAGK